MDPELRSVLARALGRAGDALDRVPESALTAGWIRAHGRPAMVAIAEAAQRLDQVPPTSPTPAMSIVVHCPDVSLHLATPWWNPTAGRVYPKRPGIPMVVAVRQALADARGRPPRVSEMVTALCAAVGCRTRTSYRALADALAVGAIVADGRNAVLPGGDMVRGRPVERVSA
jgi:hypothetical protein